MTARVSTSPDARTGRRRRYLLMAAAGLSLLGDSALLVAVPVVVKQLTGSNAAAGLTYLGVVLPSALAPLAGVLADRADNVRFIVYANLAAAAGVVPFAFAKDRSTVGLAYVVIATYGLSFYTINAGLSAYFRAYLSAAELVAVNSFISSARQVVRLAAPVIGIGILNWAGSTAVAAFDITTFLIAVVVFLTLPHRHKPDTPPRAGGKVTRLLPRLFHDIGDAAHYVAGESSLRRTILTFAFALLFMGFGTSVTFAVIEHGLHRAPTFMGIISAAQGGGAVVAGLITSRAIARIGDVKTVGAGLSLFAAGLAGYLISSTVPVLIATIIAYTGLTSAFIAFATMLQLRAPKTMAGRIWSLQDFLLGLCQAVSIVVAAVLVSRVAYQALIVIECAGVVTASIALLAFGHQTSTSTAISPESGMR